MEKNDSTLSSYDLFLELEAFSEGRSCHAWRCFGSHPVRQDGVDGYLFRVWAPNAKKLCVFGSFNDWNPESHPLKRLEGGIWEGFIPGLQRYDSYQYAVYHEDGGYTGKVTQAGWTTGPKRPSIAAP